MPFTTSPEKSEQLFRYLFEEASLGIAVEDLEGTLLLANPALSCILGFAKEELCGMSCSQFSQPEDSQDDWALFQKLRAGEIDRYSVEKRYLRGDGVRIWGRLNVSLLRPTDGEAPLVFAFVEDVTDQKRAEAALRDSEERLRLAAEAGKMYAYTWNVATDEVTRSPEYVNILGLRGEPIRLTRQQLLDRVHPDDREKFSAAVTSLTPANPVSHITYRVLLPDGAVIWLEKSARAFFDEHGKMLHMIGMVADVTDRKLAEEALSSVSRRLIEAQEQERARIARDLHDDVAQRLALLAVELERVQEHPPDSVAEARFQMGKLREQTLEVLNDVQALSHELHSSKLEYLGIVAAMRTFCREFGEQQKVEITFENHDVPSSLAPEISLCLFRVLQEAIHNAAKHSGVRHFQVQLWGTSGEIHLKVRDLGGGFDAETARKGRGLGLTSMQERLRLVSGNLSIESQPHQGTTIHARVPLGSAISSRRAAG